MTFSVRAAAAAAPGRPAIVAEGRLWTWSQAAEEAGRVAGALARRGLHAAAGVPALAVSGEGDVGTVLLLLALFELDVVPLLLHPRWTAEERRSFLAALGDPPLVAAELERAAAGWPSPPRPIDPERPLAVVPTSGSSARPRGIVLSRRAFAAAATASAANLGWRDDDRWLLALPLAHVGGLSILTRCLAARRTVVLAPAGTAVEAAVDLATREGVTLLSWVPTQLRRALAAGLRPPPSLRALLLGGAAASPELLAAAAGAGWPVLATYGATEACSQIATQRLGTSQGGELGCGPPVAGVEVRIADGGVIAVRGPNLLSGVLPGGESGLDAGGWLVTGDLGHLDAAGNLHVLGRRDDLLVTGGENVHPLEVEAALEAHPAIAEACVFGVADREWGTRLAAALVARGERPAPQALADWLATRLAGFKRPREVVWLSALDRTATGKLDRLATAARARRELAAGPR